MTATEYATLRRQGCSHEEALYLDKEPGPWFQQFQPEKPTEAST